MKTIKTILILLSFISGSLIAQEKDSTSNDTTKITWGKKKILIIGNDSWEDEDDDEPKTPAQRYNHFAGLDIGVNGFVSPNNSLDLQKEAQFLDLNYGKSIVVGLNVWEQYIPIAKEKFGIVTGLGIEYANYDLDNDIDIFHDKDTTFGFENLNKSINKNKFKTTYLNLPLMLETNIGKDAQHSFHLAAGALIGYRLGSKTKQKYSENGEGYKVKNRGDYNLNPWRLSATARVGYGDFTFFASYSLTELFEDNKGPEVYPFTIGISLITFDGD